MTVRYLNKAEFAQRIGIQPDSLHSKKYKLPPEDAVIGDRKGWLPSTVDKWNENRPGRGRWGHRV